MLTVGITWLGGLLGGRLGLVGWLVSDCWMVGWWLVCQVVCLWLVVGSLARWVWLVGC